MFRSLLFSCVLLAGCLFLTLGQQKEGCYITIFVEPRLLSIGNTREVKIVCKASLNLRLQFDRNPLMYIQKITGRGTVTMATLDGNDMVTKYVPNINVRGFFPTNFEITIKKPGCSDITSYGCGVNITNSTCKSSRTALRLQKINGVDGPPKLIVSPERPFYTEGDNITLECSSAFFSIRRIFTWNWSHPSGKEFPEPQRARKLIRSGSTCNLTNSVSLALEADDNGAVIVCLTGTDVSFSNTVTLRVARKCSTPALPIITTFKPDLITLSPPSDFVPSYSLGVLAIVVLLFTVAVYTALLLAGGTKLKFPTFRTCFKKEHVYEVPDRDATESENRYYSLKRVEPVYANAADSQQRVYEDIQDNNNDDSNAL